MVPREGRAIRFKELTQNRAATAQASTVHETH